MLLLILLIASSVVAIGTLWALLSGPSAAAVEILAITTPAIQVGKELLKTSSDNLDLKTDGDTP